MIGEAPRFTRSEFFVKDPEWHLEEGATEEEKRALEKFMNREDYGYPEEWKEKHPEMKHPWYCWDGVIRDK